MPIEQIRFVVTGVNPQTKTVNVNIDSTTGAGSTVFSLSGINPGSDTVQAFFDSKNLTSNQAAVNWQDTNGTYAVTPVHVKVYNWKVAQDGVFRVISSDVPVFELDMSGSLMFNTFPASVLPGYTNANGWNAPMKQNVLTSTGQWSSDVTLQNVGATHIAGQGSLLSFDMVVTGFLVVAAAGNVTITIRSDDGYILGIGGGATRVSGPMTDNASPAYTVSALNSYPIVSKSNQVEQLTLTSVLNFPNPGIYPFEVDFAEGSGGEMQFVMTTSGGVIRPIPYVGVPAAPGGGGNSQMVLTPNAAGPDLKGTIQNFNLNISGITYVHKPYIGLLEGIQGKLYVYNDPSNPVFNFQTYNGQAVDKIAAKTAVFQLSGDNSSWQGRLAFDYDNTNYLITYNGQPFDTHVDATQFVVTDDDVAWYNSTNKSFDLFTPSNQGGGDQFVIEVDYMVKPTVSSVTPTTVAADGTSKQFVVSLNKPFSPQQQGSVHSIGNNISASAAMTGGANVTNVTPNFDGSGWMTGWTVTATIPFSTTNLSLNLSMIVSGTLTYLSGDSFVTNTVSYINGVVGTITAAGGSFTAPQHYSFTVTPSNTTVTGNLNFQAVIFEVQNNATTLTFIGRKSGTSQQITLGAGTLTTTTAGTVGGQSGFLKTYVLNAYNGLQLDPTPGDNLGYTATDTVSNLSVSFFTSTAYMTASGGGGGGGGGACFTFGVGVQTPAGFVPFGSLPISEPFEIVNETGTHLAELVIHENYCSEMLVLGTDRLVTPDHLMKMAPGEWVAAEIKYSSNPRVTFEGTVYNLHVLSENLADKHYIIDNGDVAHNLKIQ